MSFSSSEGAPLGRAFSKFDDPSMTQSTVIIGAGIMGCATAYYLSHSGLTKPDTIHLIDASPEVFQSASGQAGGFIASDWFDPPSASLGKLSFKLHKELADKYDGHKNWGYSPSTGSSLMSSAPNGSGQDYDWLKTGRSRADSAGIHEFQSSDEECPSWLTKKEGDKVEVISDKDTVAQVDPLRLCRFLLRESVMKGVRIHNPVRAVKVSKDGTGAMSAIRVRHTPTGADHKIPCTRLLIAAGAWTPQVFDELFPYAKQNIPISPYAGHSIVVKSPRWTQENETKGCHALFTTSKTGFSPEIFSRIGEEIYISGLNDPSLPLPDTPDQAKVDEKAIAQLKEVAQNLLGQAGGEDSDLEIIREGLCFRPITAKGAPILAKVPDEDLGGITTKQIPDGGVFIAAGHGPWGISQSLGTGKVMSEMMQVEELSADVGGLRLY